MSEAPEIEEIIEKENPSIKKIAAVDTGANVVYSIIVGAGLDYASGLNFYGLLVSRGSGGILNSVTGGLYGWCREKAYKITKTDEKSGRIRKTLVDLLAFNSYKIPMYAAVISIASLLTEGEVNWEKVQNGAIYLASISPFIGPTLGWFIDGARRLFGIKSAAEGAYKKSAPKEAKK